MEPEPIRVVIVEDHAMVAEALAGAVERQAGIAIAAVTGSLREAREAVAREQPDVLLMDYRLPDGMAIEAVADLKEASPGVAVLLITAEPAASVATSAVDAGCAGLVPKGEGIDEVISAIRAVHRGESAYAPELLIEAMRSRHDDTGGPEELTARELEVLALLSAGTSTTGIADQLVVSVHTVRNHVRNLTAKLGARSRLEAVAIARRKGLVERGDA